MDTRDYSFNIADPSIDNDDDTDSLLHIIKPFEPIASYLTQTREVIADYLRDSIGSYQMKSMLEYLIKRSGKMLRPGLVLLSGHYFGNVTSEHVRVAALVEMVHNATLLHDDVIDEGKKRRGLPTVNSIWGNESAVLLGDFVLSRVFKTATELKPEIAKIIASTAIRVCEGEINQVTQKQNWNISESGYIDIITAKSASFMSGCCRLGALLSEADKISIDKFAEYGLNCGIAFQITDDLLDITANEKQIGKTSDNDIRKRKLTLPAIHLLSSIDDIQKQRVINLLKNSNHSNVTLKKMLNSNGSIDYTKDKAQQYVIKALKELDYFPESSDKKNLFDLAQFMVERAA